MISFIVSDGMTAGNLELSQITMATVVALAPLVTTANSLVTIVMMMSLMLTGYVTRRMS